MADTLKVEVDIDRILKPQDRLFEPIYHFLVIVAGIAYSASIFINGDTHTTPNPVMRVATKWPDFGLALPLGGVIPSALLNVQPAEIHIGIITNPGALAKQLPSVVHETGGFHATLNHAIEPIFLAYFERYNDWLTANYGDGVNWPPTLNFARVVRNAAAHGKINIRNPGAIPVTWRDLSYGYRDNGRRIIGTDMSYGEVIALMFDADDALTALGAPIL